MDLLKLAGDGQKTLLQLLAEAGAPPPALCAGKGRCGKCRVRVQSGSLPQSAADERLLPAPLLAAGWRLACTARPAGPVTVQRPQSEAAFAALTDFTLAGTESGAEATPAPQGAAQHTPAAAQSAGAAPGGYGIAVDIGTTTLGFALIELASGKTAGFASAVNKQRRYGADVISRIEQAGQSAGAAQAMCQSVRSQIAEGVQSLLAGAGAGPAQIKKMAVCGNTTMLHLLLGLSCQSLGVYPFTPLTLGGQRLPYAELFGPELGCEVTILPGLSTFVGADITAGILYTGLLDEKAPALLLDIGTNGEMALAANGRLLCTSTAAGPAFEGGNIEYGTGSVPGAISAAWWNGAGFDIDTIGGAPPIGICGSGVIDLCAQALPAGLIDESGLLTAPGGADSLTVAAAQNGEVILFTQQDVRQVQLAKSAVRAGLQVLLAKAGLGEGEVAKVYLAGGFGHYMDSGSAAAIGLIPPEFAGVTAAVGNSALGGAAAWLAAPGAPAALAQITAAAQEVELSKDGLFAELFIEHMAF